MAEILCPFPECNFTVGEDVPSDCKSTVLQLHLAYHQSTRDSTAAQPEKLKRPSISVGSSTEDWSYFQSRWNTYKSATRLSGEAIMVQMLECCDEALRKDLNRVYKNAITKMNESKLTL